MISVEELRNQLNEDTILMIENLSTSDGILFYKKTHKLEKERSKRLNMMERSTKK